MKKDVVKIGMIMGKWVGGGVESVIMNYYRNIDRNKFQFDFICDSDSTDIPYDEIEKLGGRVIIVPPYQKLFSYLKELESIFKENNYKIVHSNINTLSVFPLYVAKKAGIPVRIAHSHSTTSPKEFKRNLLKNILKLFSKTFATDYFACSELAGRFQFGNKAFDEGKVTIINNAIDLEKYKYDEELRMKKRQELGISENTLVIGHIGRFVTVKNHSYLIDIFNEIQKLNNDSILLLAGQGPLENNIKSKVKELHLENKVKFLGQRSDVNELYQVFDVFLLPSLYEGLPVVGVEAQATGNFCILSDKMTKETKITDTTIFINIENDPIKWANKVINISKLYHKKDVTEEITNTGFNIKKEAHKLEEEYEELLQKGSKKVMHLISTSNFSGAENVACQIINCFKNDKNYKMLYVSEIGNNEQSLKDRNIEYYKLKKFNYINIKKAMKEIDPNIIHAHDIRASVIAAILKKKKVKIISHIHSNHENMRCFTLKSIMFKIFSKKIDKIIWVSKSAFENYIFKKTVSEKSEVIYNVIDTSEIKSKAKEDKNKYPHYNLIYIGRMSYAKNPERLIEIIKKLNKSNNHLKVALIGTGELEETVKSLIKKFKLETVVDYYGFLTNPYKILNISDMMIMTSRYEGTPMCALEAISLGKPIITTPTDGLIDIVKNNETGFISNKNDEIIEKINMLLKNPGKLEQMKDNVLIQSKKINNINLYRKKIEEIYQI